MLWLRTKVSGVRILSRTLKVIYHRKVMNHLLFFVDVVCQRLKRHIIHALAQRFIKSHLSRIVSTTAMPEAGITHFEGVK